MIWYKVTKLVEVLVTHWEEIVGRILPTVCLWPASEI